MMNKKIINSISKKENLFPTNLFGKSDVDNDINKRKKVLEKAKQETEEQKNYQPELTPYERVGLSKELLEASKKGKVDIVKELLENNFDLNVNVKNPEGWTPLMFASYHGRNEVVSLLLKQPNIDVYAKDNEGWTALKYALWNGGTKSLIGVSFLIESGINVPLKYLHKIGLKNLFKYGIRKFKIKN